MALPHRNTRLITVDGVTYRWLLSRVRSRWFSDHVIIVETADAPAGKMLAKPTAIDPMFGDDYDYAITPALVESGIRKAISNGWEPSDRGTFELPCPYDRIQ